MSSKSAAANGNDQAEAKDRPLAAPAPIDVEALARDERPASPAPAGIADASAQSTTALRRKPRWGRRFLMAALPLALLVGGTYVWVSGGRFEETDNANLRQARVDITSEASGRIVSVNINENQTVKQGDLLFAVDQQPYRIALSQAEAALASARLNVEQFRASYSQSVAARKIDEDQTRFLQDELDRQSALTAKGVGTRVALDQARNDLQKARSQLAAAAQAVIGAQAALGGDPDIKTDRHPAVLAAQAARDKAAFDLSQTEIRSPGDGVVYQAASLKPGQFVAMGVPLFTLIETGDTWVDANFKETQLTHLKVGQPAEITLDAFPDRRLTATVDSIGAGTGAEFSVLPAQNATGNWVKVTQRIPVRLKVESADSDLLLRSGMSAAVEIDTGKARGWDGLERLVQGWLPASLSGQAVAAQ